MNGKPPFQEKFAAAASQSPLGLDRLPRIAGTTDEYRARPSSPQLPLEDFDRIDLHIDEIAPFFVVRMKPLHESGITVGTAMRAASITIERVAAQRAGIENALAHNLAYDRA